MRTSATRVPTANRVMQRALASPISGVVDAAVMLITVRGRRTGREHTFPVQYAPGCDALWVLVARPESKTWWRNLSVPSPVRLRLRGEVIEGTAQVLAVRSDRADLDEGLVAYRTRFPRAGRLLDDGDHDVILVRVAIPDEVLRRTRDAVVVRGRGIPAWARRHPVGAFFVLTYLMSWGYWIPVAVAGGHWSHFPGLAGPLIAATIVTALTTGSTGLSDLGARMGRWRIAPRWYAACLVPVAAALVALAALAAVGASVPSMAELSHMPGLPELGWLAVFALVVLVNGYGEETGWRGFAWTPLRQRHTLAGAALLLAVPWATWHVPTFWIDSGMSGFPPLMLPGFVVGLAAGAVILGSLYEQARSSILLVAIWHAALNMFSATEGAEGFVAATVSAAVILWAVALLRIDAAATGRAPRSATHRHAAHAHMRKVA